MMTTASTERSTLSKRGSSGGEFDSDLDSAHPSNDPVPVHGQLIEANVQLAKQAIDGRLEPSPTDSVDSRPPQSKFTSIESSRDPLSSDQNETESSQTQSMLQRDETTSEHEADSAEPMSLSNDTIEEALPYFPERPIISSFTTRPRRIWEMEDLSKPQRPDTKDQAEGKPLKNRYVDTARHQHDYFSPWQGNHVEDRTPEVAIKSGYQVKQQVVNETNTARPTLGPHLKTNAGFHNLSNFFGSILQKRHEHGKITAPPTFKPPPRVTLTDTKREVWLVELANPLVPLRKLSRTIPHGIRGRILLEQCMAKEVPPTRAIWLAKCVGANELRAFRRKGISGVVMLENEHKWIREWTIVVESFLEDTGRASGDPEWKEKVLYALRLTARIISDDLLEKDHFMDWALSRIEWPTYESLPFALVVVQMINPMIVESIRHGRRMAKTLLSKLHDISISRDKAVRGPLITQLEQLMTQLAFENPECFILRQVWQRCRSTFLSVVDRVEHISERDPDESLRSLKVRKLRQLMERNDLIIRASSKTPIFEEAEVLSLVQKLDAFRPQTSVERIAAQCFLSAPDLRRLIPILVNWASSLHRDGQYRIFIVTRLMRLWKKEGHDTDQHILDSLCQLRGKSGLDPLKLSKLIAGLIRFDCFDTVRFLRSLISSGGLYEADRRYELQILVNMPLSNMPARVLGLRDMLLRGVGPSQENTSRQSENELRRQMENYLTLPEDRESSMLYPNLDLSILGESQLLKINAVIRRHLSVTKPKSGNLEETTEDSIPEKTHQLSQLRRIMMMLQAIGEVYALADALHTILATVDSHIFLMALQTMEGNFEDLAATGALDSLFQAAIQRYSTLRPTFVTPRTLLTVMCNISKRIPAHPTVCSYFDRELASCNANIGIAANTPMSDIQSEVIGESDSELEKILAGGSVMGFQRMSQAFQSIVSSTAKVKKFEQTNLLLFNILGSIKSQDEATFQNVLKSWLRREVSKDSSGELGKAVWFLRTAGCVDEADLTTTAVAVCEEIASEDPVAAVNASIKVLDFLLQLNLQGNLSDFFDPRGGLSGATKIWELNPECMLRLLLRALAATRHSTLAAAADSLCQSVPVLGPLKRLIVDKPNLVMTVINPAFALITPDSKARLYRTVWSLVEPSKKLGLVDLSAAEQLQHVFEAASPLSLPFSQLCLQWLNKKGSEIPNHSLNLARVCVDAVIARQAGGCWLWPRLMPSLNLKVAQQVRAIAEGQILIDASSISGALDALRASKQPDARFWSRVVEATSFSIPDQGDIEVGRSIEKHIGVVASIMMSGAEAQDELLQYWLQALCHLALIYGKSWATHTSKVKIVQGLCGLLGRDVGQLTESSTAAVFDAAAFYVEDLTTQAFSKVRSNLENLHTDRRIRFLFNIQENPDSWLHVLRARNITPQAEAAEAAEASETAASAPFPLRIWELLPEPAANLGANDTALSLRMFDARKTQ